MTISEMKLQKELFGYSYLQMSELSGVPLGTIQKIFNGETKKPRYRTLQALERLFSQTSASDKSELLYVQESSNYYAKKPGEYTIDDYRALPEEQRVELIDGRFYDMAAPTTTHQMIAGIIYTQIFNYIRNKKGDCIPMISPVDVQLDCDEKTMLQPDVLILCDKDKFKKWGIYGAPDFLLEVVSPSSKLRDYTIKMIKYLNAGVREYWIIDPDKKYLLVYYLEQDVSPTLYGLDQSVPVNIYGGELIIDVSEILPWL